ncbi:MAG: hypothetical protein LW703_14765 [Rhodobacter sp.]|nr:hypothetical protein [Rhodobacter sp.]
MRHRLRVVSPLAQPLRYGNEFIRRFLRQHRPRLLRTQRIGVHKAVAQQIAGMRVIQVVQPDGVNFLDCVRPVGADKDTVHVRHDQQRRVLQRVLVFQKLVIGGVQVFALALVLPGEAFVPPDIGPALTAAGDRRAFLKGEPFAFRIGGNRVIDPKKAAEIIEV